MADRYLIETSAVDGYLLEDGSGVLILEQASLLEDNDTFWAGAMQCFVSVAIAATVSISSSMTTQAQAVYSYEQHEIFTPAFSPDEDFWQNPVPPDPGNIKYLQPWTLDEQIPAGNLSATVDEYFWQNPVRPDPGSLLYPQPNIFDEQIPAGSLTATIDEYLAWPLLPQAQYLPPIQAYLASDEDAYPQFPVITFQPDEDFWFNPVAPLSGALAPLYLPDPEEIPAASLFQPVIDEDFWLNPVMPLAYYPLPPYIFMDEGIIVPTGTTIFVYDSPPRLGYTFDTQVSSTPILGGF